MASPAGTSCPCCTEDGTLSCSGCNEIKYCSRGCLEADWPSHKLLCQEFKDFADQYRPSADHRRIIVFPSDSENPRFEWRVFEWCPPIKDEDDDETEDECEDESESEVGDEDETEDECEDETEDAGEDESEEGCEDGSADGYEDESEDGCENETYTHHNLRDLFHESFDERCFIRSEVVDSKAFTEEPLEYELQLFYDEDFRMNFARPNQSVIRTTGGRLSFEWWGPVYAVCGTRGRRRLDTDFADVYDMDMRTYADLAAFLIDYGNEDASGRRRKGPKVAAVKALCGGERGAPLFADINVPACHPVFDAPAVVSPISKLIGMPIQTIRYSDSLLKSKNADNVPIAFMHTICDPNADLFGHSPRKWDMDVGDVLLLRADYKPLDANTAEAFAAYCKSHVSRLLERANDAERDIGGGQFKKKALKEITPANWSKFLAQWRRDNKRSQASTRKKQEEGIVGSVGRLGLG